MQSLHGRTALVTGAARRIGRAIALALAEAGAGVVVHFHRAEAEARRLRDELRARGTECWLVRADLEREPELSALVAQAAKESGRRIDALVNNAAIFPADTFETLTRESFLGALSVNTWAPLSLTRAFARDAGAGQVVNLLDAKVGGYRFTHVGYHLSKLALEWVTRALALELAPAVCVNAVAPGMVLPPPDRDALWLERQARTTVPLRRPGSPEEVTEAVLFLLGARYVTGQILYVDGGSHLLEPADGPHRD